VYCAGPRELRSTAEADARKPLLCFAGGWGPALAVALLLPARNVEWVKSSHTAKHHYRERVPRGHAAACDAAVFIGLGRCLASRAPWRGGLRGPEFEGHPVCVGLGAVLGVGVCTMAEEVPRWGSGESGSICAWGRCSTRATHPCTPSSANESAP